MSQPYIGQIMMVGFNFPPAGWANCDGQLMPISENEALFQIIGTTYGGDGQETFGLPNMQSRVAVHMGQGPGVTQNYQIGETGGVEQVTLTTQQIPSHNHNVQVLSGNTSANQSTPSSSTIFQTRLRHRPTRRSSTWQTVAPTSPHWRRRRSRLRAAASRTRTCSNT